MADTEYTLGEPAEEVYKVNASGVRNNVVAVARDMAELTIPSIFPPDGWKPGDDLPGNNQSVGAHCVKTLASALLFMAFPPGRPILKYEPIEHRLTQEMEADPQFWSKIEYALSRKELEHRRRLLTTQLPMTYSQAIGALLVGGNVLWKHIKLETPTYHLPTCYIVKRDATGQPYLVIHEEEVLVAALDADVREIVLANEPALEKTKEWERTACLYSVLKLKVDANGDRSWLYWQEHKGTVIPDTEVETDFDTPPMYPAWMVPVYGQDWGLGYAEGYRGDHYTVENHSSAINDAASVLALMLLFVKPGARTSVKQIKEAENLSVFSGSAEDVTALRIEKGGDLSIVSQNLEAAIQRLGVAYLMQFAIRRDAERVTAEEWQRLGTELDKAMGGLYTQVSQSFQRYVVKRFIALHEEEADSPPRLPDGLIRAEPITGVDAMGQNTETQSLLNLGQAVQGIFGPEKTAEAFEASDFIRRLGTGMGIQMRGLVKDAAQVTQDQNAQQQNAAAQTVLKEATGPAIKGIADNFNKQPRS